jgi:hydrogenase maturation protein HypF
VLPDAVAPANAYLGIMLPYTPLHYLLLYSGDGSTGARFRALVMTSGNRHDEPICRTEEDARDRLSGIADYFLVHDRPIHNRCDDSLLQTVPGNTRAVQFIRRSRGYVPDPVRLKISGDSMPTVLAAGAELKNTFCLTRAADACVSPYIGDLDNNVTLGFYREAVERLSRFLKVKPLVIAHDLHPDYLSTQFAKELLRRNRRLIDFPVQHHQAHLASVLAEKQLDRPAIGFAYDGNGYGLDGKIWGGECFLYRQGVFTRQAHFEYFPLPGGDRATREIWRLAVSLLHQAGLPVPRALTRRYPCREIIAMMEKGINSPLTSSDGRLFDAVAALSGIRHEVTFEAQAAMELEALSLDKTAKKEYNFDIFSSGETPHVVTLKRTLSEIVQDVNSGATPGCIGARFHATLAAITVRLAKLLKQQHGVSTVLLSGGVFQNRLLLSMIEKALTEQGFSVHYNTIVPPNDGGVSLGQAWMALKQYQQA